MNDALFGDVDYLNSAHGFYDLFKATQEVGGNKKVKASS